MAKTTCSVCGKEISTFQNIFATGSAYLDEINSTITICSECNKQKLELISNSKEMNEAFKDAQLYFEKHISEGRCSKEAQLYIENKISEYNEIYNAVIKETETDSGMEKIMEQLPELLKNFKVNTGYHFEGYEIVEYKDIFSAETVLGTGIFSEINASMADIFGSAATSFEKKLDEAKKEVLKKLRVKAIVEGCNALIGVDLDIMCFSGNMIAVSGNGTGVIIKKIENMPELTQESFY